MLLAHTQNNVQAKAFWQTLWAFFKWAASQCYGHYRIFTRSCAYNPDIIEWFHSFVWWVFIHTFFLFLRYSLKLVHFMQWDSKHTTTIHSLQPQWDENQFNNGPMNNYFQSNRSYRIVAAKNDYVCFKSSIQMYDICKTIAGVYHFDLIPLCLCWPLDVFSRKSLKWRWQKRPFGYTNKSVVRCLQ